MQKLSKSKVHTWGIVGAGFFANCAPSNYIGINILTAKGAQGHIFFQFLLYGKRIIAYIVVLEGSRHSNRLPSFFG